MTVMILIKSFHAMCGASLHTTHASSSFYSTDLLDVFLLWENAINIGFICHQPSLQNMQIHKYTCTQKLQCLNSAFLQKNSYK